MYYKNFTEMISDSTLQHFKNLTVKVWFSIKKPIEYLLFPITYQHKPKFFSCAASKTIYGNTVKAELWDYKNLSSIKTHIKKIYKNATLLNDLFWKKYLSWKCYLYNVISSWLLCLNELVDKWFWNFSVIISSTVNISRYNPYFKTKSKKALQGPESLLRI